MKSDVTSEELETAYCNYLSGVGSDVYPFSTHRNDYELNFKTMIQKNLVYRTERNVRRRPKFLTDQERHQLARYVLVCDQFQ